MKKTYKKPQLIFDSFGVAVNIASNCMYTDANQTQGQCSYNYYGWTIFIDASQGCSFTAPDGSFNVCYYVPSADNTLFNS